MGERKPREEKQEEEQPVQEGQEIGTQIVEVPINLELLNNKLNYLIASVDQIKKQLAK